MRPFAQMLFHRVHRTSSHGPSTVEGDLMMNQLHPKQISWLDSIEHRDWLARHREALLDFFQPEAVS